MVDWASGFFLNAADFKERAAMDWWFKWRKKR
jgi:hypothetical protein